ncbi:uncharacterized protein RSE6_03273 [Rhynchosporium secalis]|uniref:C2H2-type domain-containing protein n=1 Tax=Rhynchosporium secalis TaxID=38038 RepID=A0A1E1M3V6_RHYSE|nr:uncharacterized protein RSE6_03273 [Rhynchosporium secalis]
MEISRQKVYVHHPCNSREGLDPNQLGSHTTLRGLLAEGAGGQDISDSDRKDIPQSSCSDDDSSKVQATPSYMRTSSNFVRENSDTDRDISDSSRRLLPSIYEAPPPSFTWSIYSGLLTPPQHDFSPQTQIPIGDSVGLDEYDSDLESLNYTESSEESKNTGPSLVQLGRGGAPEVALALEATRRTIVDLLQVLAVPVGVSAQNIVSCTQDSGPSRKPGPGGEASDQTSSKGKAPVKNSGFGKRKKSGIDDDDGGDHGDGDGDACMGDGRDSKCPNQAHCTGCHSSDSSIPGKIRSKHMVTADSGKPLLKQCLYFAHNSDTYQDESCDNPISEVHRLYQHIDRHHRIFLCNRCQEPFKTEPLLKEHGKGGQDCMWKERDDYSTGCTDGQRLALLKKIPKIRNQTIDDGDKWRMKYRILFPNTPESEIPSPHMEVPNVTMSEMRDTMEVFCNFFKEQIATRICSDLQALWNIDFDVNVQRHTNAIISEYHAMQRARKNIEPPSSPRKKHKPAASTPGPQPTLAGQKKIYSQDQTLAWMGAAPALHPNVAFSFHGDASMMAPETPGLSQSQSGSFNTQASYLPYTPFNSGYPMNSEYPCDRAQLSFPNPAEGDDQDMEILPLLTDEEFAALLQIRFPSVPLPKVFSEGESDLEQLTLANTAGRPGKERTPNSLMVPNTQPPGCCPNWPRCVHWGDNQWSTTSSSVFRRPES